MCGVAGLVSSNFSQEYIQNLLTRMLSRISHRGPDESGIFLNEGIGLGNVRLSIIDLSTGQQPMHTPDFKLWIVFNGEIFNYKELREELVQKGHTFSTTSDTEVLLHLYREYGESCLHKLNGQFVFAVWDTQAKELFIARDRVGIRPLFYYHRNGAFVFASEIKSILEYEQYSPEIDFKALSQVFTLWTSLTPHTVFKEIRELSPGHYLKLKNGNLQISSYWSLNFNERRKNYSLDQVVEEFEELLTDSCKLRMRADVPVAAYLSGGLDSSATTAIIKKIIPEQLHTFSIGFTDKEFDETVFQNQVSAFLDTQHHAFSCTPKDIAEVFPSVIWHSEIPLTRTAPAPLFLLSQKVRQGNIKVVITGEGADEMLAGYDIFKETKIRHFWAKDTSSKIRPLLLKKLYPYIPQISAMNAQALRFVFGYKLDETEHPFYSHLLRWNNSKSIQRYFSADFLSKVDCYDPATDFLNLLPSDFSRLSPVEKAQWIESTYFLSGYLLSSQGDRVAMANSVEGRYPFLDYRIIEFCASLPEKFKLSGLNEKYLLKKLMNGKLPDNILTRPKQAYRAPIISSFFNNPPDYLSDLLSKKSFHMHNLFDFVKVQDLINKQRSGKVLSEIDAMAITAIISTHLFSSIFIQKSQFKPAIQLLKPTIYLQPKNQQL